MDATNPRSKGGKGGKEGRLAVPKLQGCAGSLRYVRRDLPATVGCGSRRKWRALARLGGPPPGFPQKEHFLCGTSSEKASREGPNIQRKTARRFPRIGDGTLTPLSWRTTPSIRITSPSTWESVHVSTLPRDAY